MEFLIWLAGLVVIHFILKLWNGHGDAGMAYAFLFFGSWTVFMIAFAVIHVAGSFFGIHGIKVY